MTLEFDMFPVTMSEMHHALACQLAEGWLAVITIIMSAWVCLSMSGNAARVSTTVSCPAFAGAYLPQISAT